MSVPSGGQAIGHRSVVSRSREIPPVAAQAVLAEFGAPRVQWHSPDGLEIVGAGAAAHVTASSYHRFDRVRAVGEALLADADHDGPPVTRPRLFGGVAFTDDHTPTAPWNGFEAAGFLLPRVQVTNDGETTYLTVTQATTDPRPAAVASTLDAVTDRVVDLPEFRPRGDPPGVRDIVGSPDRGGWDTQVREAVAAIRGGDLQKVVLARAVEATLDEALDVPQVLARLRHRYSDCYRFLVEPPEGSAFFGASPERFLRKADRTVETEALAGSVDRGETAEADARLAEELRTSTKLQAEQALVVDAITDQLAPVGTVSVGDRSVRRFTNIQHLHTPITAALTEDHHVLDLVESLHPTPAVGGVPPGPALDTIRGTESFDRGWYAAPIGWFDAGGDGEFAVAIRSAVAADRSVTLFAGNGIVAGSDPDEEWAELQSKYEPLLAELR